MGTRFPWAIAFAVLVFCTPAKEESAPLPEPNVEEKFVCTTPAEPPEDFSRLNGFGFGLYASIVTGREQDRNLVVSPLAAAVALGMLHLGATGEKNEISNVLVGSVDDALDEKIGKLLEDTQRCSLGVTSAVANAIWVNEQEILLPSYTKSVQDVYHAEVSSPIQQAAVDAWVDAKTRGRISSIPVDPRAIALILNALYFKGVWTFVFDENDTKEGPFTLESGQTTKVQFMFQNGEGAFEVARTGDTIAVRLPFAASREAAMSFVMPVTAEEFRSFESAFTADTWQRIRAKFHESGDAELFLPKFTVNDKPPIGQGLWALGLRRVWRPDAELDGMLRTADDKFGSILQKTFLEVNERGAEAAAVTAISINNSVSIPEVYRFDRPFLVVLEDKRTGVVSFVGSITNPK